MAPSFHLFIFNKLHQSLAEGLSIIWKIEVGDEILNKQTCLLGKDLYNTTVAQK